MARSQILRDYTREAAFLFDEVATDYRNKGHTRERAFVYASEVLGVTLRRFKAVLWGEPTSLHDEDLRQIKRAYLRHLDAEAEDLAKRSAAARARRQQMELDI